MKRKSSHLAFVRRFNIAGPNTRIMAIVSDEEFTPTQTMSLITNISLEDAKILALWINTTMHVLQMVVERVETEGSYMELPEWAMKNLYIINPNTLSKKQRERTLQVFAETSNIKFPSIIEQLEYNFPPRRKIDELFIDILGLDVHIKELHEVTLREIMKLKSLIKSSDDVYFQK